MAECKWCKTNFTPKKTATGGPPQYCSPECKAARKAEYAKKRRETRPVISFLADADTLREIEAFAAERGISRSKAARELLESGLEEK